MARYKHYDYAQMKLVPVSFEQQILPGTFEHTLSELIDGPCIDPTQRLGICVHTHPFPYSDLCSTSDGRERVRPPRHIRRQIANYSR